MSVKDSGDWEHKCRGRSTINHTETIQHFIKQPRDTHLIFLYRLDGLWMATGKDIEDDMRLIIRHQTQHTQQTAPRSRYRLRQCAFLEAGILPSSPFPFRHTHKVFLHVSLRLHVIGREVVTKWSFLQGVELKK